jgi:hypothetical protein
MENFKLFYEAVTKKSRSDQHWWDATAHASTLMILQGELSEIEISLEMDPTDKDDLKDRKNIKKEIKAVGKKFQKSKKAWEKQWGEVLVITDPETRKEFVYKESKKLQENPFDFKKPERKIAPRTIHYRFKKKLPSMKELEEWDIESGDDVLTIKDIEIKGNLVMLHLLTKEIPKEKDLKVLHKSFTKTFPAGKHEKHLGESSFNEAVGGVLTWQFPRNTPTVKDINFWIEDSGHRLLPIKNIDIKDDRVNLTLEQPIDSYNARDITWFKKTFQRHFYDANFIADLTPFFDIVKRMIKSGWEWTVSAREFNDEFPYELTLETRTAFISVIIDHDESNDLFDLTFNAQGQRSMKEEDDEKYGIKLRDLEKKIARVASTLEKKVK